MPHNSRMRILHVIPSVHPAGGGPIEAVTRLGVEYERLGSEVEVLTLDDPQADCLRTFPLRCHPMGPAHLKYGYSSKLVPWLREHAASFDLVVVNGVWQYTSFAVWRVLRGSKTPYVVFTHGMLDPWFKRRYPLKHLKKWLYWPWAEYRVLRDAAAVLFTSEEERRLARRSFWLYRCREQVINYGTAAPPPDDNTGDARFRAKFPSVGDRRIILFLGRIHEKKGCELLIRAFGTALKERNDAGTWQLVLAGPETSQAYTRSLERLIERTCPPGSVTWTGMLIGEMKWAAFRAADVFALTSRQENFGVAVAESLACSRPVLLTNKVNIWREIADDNAGFIENDDDEGALALLNRWMNLKAGERERMRANAHRCFTTRFDVRHTAVALTSTLKALV
jgi:glycosyltransferase involved in cell wall biosynthesis